MNVGHSMQVWLCENEKTVNWLADQLCVTRATASAIVNDPRKGLNRIDEISCVCDISIRDFLELAGRYEEGTMSASRRWYERYKA